MDSRARSARLPLRSSLQGISSRELLRRSLGRDGSGKRS